MPSYGAQKVRRRARLRAEELANQGTIEGTATFLVSGVVWGPLQDDSDADLDMRTGIVAGDDLVAGPSAVQLVFLRAHDVASAE